jgi:hypothetical protein
MQSCDFSWQPIVSMSKDTELDYCRSPARSFQTARYGESSRRRLANTCIAVAFEIMLSFTGYRMVDVRVTCHPALSKRSALPSPVETVSRLSGSCRGPSLAQTRHLCHITRQPATTPAAPLITRVTVHRSHYFKTRSLRGGLGTTWQQPRRCPCHWRITAPGRPRGVTC